MERQIKLLAWPCLSLTEKQWTINHMVIFNDSISKFYKCSIRGFCRGISMFLVSTSAKKKKNTEAIKFLRILKKYFSKNKIYFYLKKKSNVSLNGKVTFVFHTNFKLDSITQIIYCIIHMCLSSLFIHFLFSYILHVIETMLNIPYAYLAKVQQQNE